MASLSLWFSQRVLSYAVCFHQENVRARAVVSLSLRLFIPRAGGRVLCRRRRMVSAGGAMLEGSDHSGGVDRELARAAPRPRVIRAT